MMRTDVTSEQIRAAIDSVRTGEKVGYPDPAAVPLGADDEAAGHSPSPEERRIAMASQPVTAGKHPDYGIVYYLAAAGIIAAVIIFIVSQTS